MSIQRLGTLSARFVFLVLVSVTLPGRCAVASSIEAGPQSRASFETAIHNRSTSPSYVRVSIINDQTGQARDVCTTANFLLGAIHHEYGLGYGATDSTKAEQIAIEGEHHVFHFHTQEALDNIPVRYSEKDLAAARAFLAPLSASDIESGFSSLSSHSRLATTGYVRDAIACALIERGFSPRQADRSGQVYIGR
jgi:hypothetical protein